MIKTEMKGTGGGRWTTRADAKQTSKKARRANGKKTAREADVRETYPECAALCCWQERKRPK